MKCENVIVCDESCALGRLLRSADRRFLLYVKLAQCTDEDAIEQDRVNSLSDSDCFSVDCIMKQRRYHSSALLKKEQKLSSASPAVLIKVYILSQPGYRGLILTNSMQLFLRLYISAL